MSKRSKDRKKKEGGREGGRREEGRNENGNEPKSGWEFRLVLEMNATSSRPSTVITAITDKS